MGILYSTTYDIICTNCHKNLGDQEIGEYPWSWQFIVCPYCHGKAVPDLNNKHEHWIQPDPDHLEDPKYLLDENAPGSPRTHGNTE